MAGMGKERKMEKGDEPPLKSVICGGDAIMAVLFEIYISQISKS